MEDESLSLQASEFRQKKHRLLGIEKAVFA